MSVSLTNDALRKRLIDEGRWREALSKREREKRRLMSEGVERREAARAAWALLHEVYQVPLSVDEFLRYEPKLPDLPPDKRPNRNRSRNGDSLPGGSIEKKVLPAEGMASGKGVWKQGDFSGRSGASQVEIIQWIFDNMGFMDLTPEMAPSSGAWFYLQDLRRDVVLRNEFYRNVYPKTFPSNTAREDQLRRIHDDGKRVIRIIDVVLDAIPAKNTGRVLSLSPERGQGELGIPQTDS